MPFIGPFIAGVAASKIADGLIKRRIINPRHRGVAIVALSRLILPYSGDL